MPDLTFLFIAGSAVFLGAVVQGSVGLGLGLVSAPVVALVEPSLLPGAPLVVALVMPALTLRDEWRHIDRRGLAWGVPARIPGSLAGAWLVAVLEPRALGAAVGVMVLLAVAATVWALRVRITPVSLMAAGLASGVTGTATSIGGPPIALLYQHAAGPAVRATLAGYFLCGAAISLAALGLSGQLTAAQVTGGLALLPFMLAGFAAARPVRRRFAAGSVRTALLCVVAASGLALLARAAW